LMGSSISAGPGASVVGERRLSGFPNKCCQQWV